MQNYGQATTWPGYEQAATPTDYAAYYQQQTSALIIGQQQNAIQQQNATVHQNVDMALVGKIFPQF